MLRYMYVFRHDSTTHLLFLAQMHGGGGGCFWKLWELFEHLTALGGEQMVIAIYRGVWYAGLVRDK